LRAVRRLTADNEVDCAESPGIGASSTRGPLTFADVLNVTKKYEQVPTPTITTNQSKASAA
jgi:hypothetical protein